MPLLSWHFVLVKLYGFTPFFFISHLGLGVTCDFCALELQFCSIYILSSSSIDSTFEEFNFKLKVMHETCMYLFWFYIAKHTGGNVNTSFKRSSLKKKVQIKRCDCGKVAMFCRFFFCFTSALTVGDEHYSYTTVTAV